MGSKAPILAYVVALHHPRAQWPPIDAVMVRTEYYCDRNTRFVNFDRKILVASFFHHGERAPQWRAWGAHLRAKYHPTGAQIRIYCTDACPLRLCSARNWFNFSLGTKLWSPWKIYPKIMFQLYFLAGSTLNLKEKQGLQGAKKIITRVSSNAKKTAEGELKC